MKDKLGAFAFITLIVAILGVVVPIIWDYYSGQKGVSLTLMSRNQLISTSAGVEGIEVSYKGTKLTVLSKMTFLLENTGSKPILKADVVTPLTLSIPQKGNVLDAMIESKTPVNIDLFIIRNKHDIVIDYSLLNPGDKASISILIDSSDADFVATTRIAGVKDLTVNYEPPKTLTIWALVWIPVGLLSLALVLISFTGFIIYPKEMRVKKAIKNGTLIVPEFKSHKEAHEWVKKTTSFTTATESRPAFNLLKELEEKGLGYDKDIILKTVQDVVVNSTNNLVMACVVSTIGGYGLYYALNSLGYF